MRKVMLGAGIGAMLLAGAALVVNAQGPPPGGFGGRGPGGPMAGMFEFGGLMGGFGGRVVTGKPVTATFTITHTETLPGNTITNTTTGTFARGADGSTYRDVKFTAIGPWAASGKAQEFIYIRNQSTGMQYIVNVTKGTYEAFAIHEHKTEEGPRNRANRPNSNDEIVNDNPNGSYTDPVTKTVYPADDRQVTRTIPVGAIGNQLALTITSERWRSTALDLLLEDTRTDPRFGTTTYQLSNIGQSPASSLFTPDPSFMQVQGKGFGPGGHHERGQQPPPPPQN
nr:hypothetical protein [Candidatus Acidoferrales bacterium]